jgi:hypothetical protein
MIGKVSMPPGIQVVIYIGKRYWVLHLKTKPFSDASKQGQTYHNFAEQYDLSLVPVL